MNEKLILLGYDGVPFNLLMGLVNSGKLPNFEKIIVSGTSGVLKSTLPPISPVAWPSMLSGENPGKHGIFSFFEHDAGLMKSNTSRNIRGRTIFDILSFSNKKILAVNIPCTYPAWEINGILIPGFPVPGKNNKTFPMDIMEKIEKEIGKYYIDLPSEGLHSKGLTEEIFLKELVQVTQKRTDAILYALDNYKWDFFMGVYIGTDRILHAYYGNYYGNNILYDESKKKIIDNYFQQLDYDLGRILSVIDDSTSLMIVSDHGFEPFNKIIGINNVLQNANLIPRKTSLKSIFKKELLKLFKKYDIINLINMEKINKRIFMKDPLGLSRSGEFNNSIAISLYIQGISINKNKLSGYTYKELKDKIINLTLSIKDPQTGLRIIEKVYDKTDLYYGNNLEKAPDLLLIPKEGYAIGRWFTAEPQPISNFDTGIPRTGTHAGFNAQKGMYAIYGNDVKKNFRHDACILDIAPTILHYYSLPIRKNMDGQVLKNAFIPNSKFNKNQVIIQTGLDTNDFIENGDKSDLSEDDEQLIIRRLKKLGYVE